MNTANVFGQRLDFAEFEGVAEPEEIVKIISGAAARVANIPGIDIPVIALDVINALREARKTYDPAKGAKFSTYAFRAVGWAVDKGLRSRDALNEAQCKVPRGQISAFHRLDEPYEDLAGYDSAGGRLGNRHEVVASADASADTIVDAKALISELADPVMVMLGIARVIPLPNRQRSLDVFEASYGLNGRDRQTATEVAEHWHINTARPIQLVKEVWAKLQVARSPIKTALDLENILRRLEDLENIIGEPVVIRPCMPSPQEKETILERFAKADADRKLRNKANGYQLALGPIQFLRGRTRKETMVLAVCQAFGITPEELRSEDSCDKLSKARHIAAYLLYCDLSASIEEICRFIGRKKLMVFHGKNQTAQELGDGNYGATEAVKMVRSLYAQAYDPAFV